MHLGFDIAGDGFEGIEVELQRTSCTFGFIITTRIESRILLEHFLHPSRHITDTHR